MAPDPPPIPYEPVEDNIDKIKEFIVQYYSSSTMNMCLHQKLPEIAGQPLSIKLKDWASPVAVHTPATVPVHWHAKVKEQLDRDVRMGILEPVGPNEPAVWQHRMVVVRKKMVPQAHCRHASPKPSHSQTDSPVDIAVS